MGRRLSMLTVVLLVSTSACPAVAAQPPARVGIEFQANIYTVGRQNHPSVAADAAGNFVVVWLSDAQDGDASGVFAQRFDASGVRSGTEFQVNTYTLFDQGGIDSPDVSSDADGQLVVVWSFGGPKHIFAQRYDNGGLATGTEFLINSYTGGAQIQPAIASAANGDFVVVWTEFTALDGSSFGLFGRRFSSSGMPFGADFQVNACTVGSQGGGASIVFDDDANFVVVWTSLNQDGDGFGAFGRRFDSTGAPLGSEFQVSAFSVYGQLLPSVGAQPDGDFVVAWRTFDGASGGVQARRFASNGAPIGSNFQVNSHTLADQEIGRRGIFVDESGRFVVVWASTSQDGSNLGSFGQRYESDGSQLGAEFQINTFTPTSQYEPVVSGGADNFVVAWTSNQSEPNPQDGSSAGIFAQVFVVDATDTPTPTRTITPTSTYTPTVTPTATPVGICPSIVDAGCTIGFATGALFLKEDVAGKEKLLAKMAKGPALAQTAMGNPLTGSTVYSLCIYDDTGNLAGGINSSVVVDRADNTCVGLPCWKPVGGDPPSGKGYKYKDPALDSDGVRKLLYKGGESGTSKAIVKGQGPNLPNGIPAALQTTMFATVQLRSSDGICLSVVVDDIKKQGAAFFKAKFSAP